MRACDVFPWVGKEALLRALDRVSFGQPCGGSSHLNTRLLIAGLLGSVAVALRLFPIANRG